MTRILWMVLLGIPLVALADDTIRLNRLEANPNNAPGQCIRSSSASVAEWQDCNYIKTWDDIKPHGVTNPDSELFAPPESGIPIIIICQGCAPTDPCTEGEDTDTSLAFWATGSNVEGHWSCNGTSRPGLLVIETTTTTTTTESTTTTEETTTTTESTTTTEASTTTTETTTTTTTT